MKWKILDIPDNPKLEPDKFKLIVRLNALGSLYFFEKFVLQRNKLTERLHKPILDSLETNRLRFLLEMPRDHYKTVMVTEGRTMWRALPFNERDEIAMRELGYDDSWVSWMRETHDAARRTLTVSEILGNAIMIGYRIDWHYRENQLFRQTFPEILPDAKCVWTNESKQQKCAGRGPQGEGTFDYLGVGGALQSRHYSDLNEDDVIGKDALESTLVMNKAIDYHKLLIGAFESFSTGAWTVVNNRWAPNDLSGWIREHQPEFIIESHSAEGGCCPRHPSGEPIFPEEFSKATLASIRQIQGPYFYSHQFLNLPVNPEECIFNKDWLRFYSPTPNPYVISATSGDPNPQTRHWIKHDVKAGETIADLNPNILMRSMIVDPNHSGAEGRSRHAIVITGLDPETDNVYLLDVWAKSMSYDDLMANIYRMAGLWGLREFWLETVAAQKYLKYHIEYRNKIENRSLTVKELKGERGPNAKRVRIESMEPVFRANRFWVRQDQSEFLEEYYNYPGGRTLDVLDCLGFASQTWNAIHARKILKMLDERRQLRYGRRSLTGY